MGLGAAIGALVTERTRTLRATDASLCAVGSHHV
jgi:hypothetical protein